MVCDQTLVDMILKVHQAGLILAHTVSQGNYRVLFTAHTFSSVGIIFELDRMGLAFISSVIIIIHHSFILSKCFILVMVAVHTELIPGTQGVNQIIR